MMNITKPNRKKHSYTQHLNAPPEAVFPLLCPVAELKWAPGWMPEVVFSVSGVVEQECIFITPPEFPSEPQNSIWVVSNYDPGNLSLVMYKVTPEHTISKLEISLENDSENTTSANISYEVTVIGMAGNSFMEEFTTDWYRDFMLDWEKALNHYLKTGEKIV
jgi:hypothetical protein